MYIKIHTYPGEKKESIKTISEHNYEIYVREKAENGRANKRVMEILRTLYPSRRLILVAGHHSPHKIVHFEE